ncbi:MAG: hypothetical protein R2748_24730 [Bryobacterales bacterium]
MLPNLGVIPSVLLDRERSPPGDLFDGYGYLPPVPPARTAENNPAR